MSKREDWSMAEWRDYYEGLRQRADDNYQSTGESRYDSQQLKYSVIVDAFDGYIQNRSEVDSERARRQKNIESFIEQNTSHKNDYTRDEVIDLLRRVKQF